jgi:hypothetical protein
MGSTAQELAIDKLSQCVPVVLSIMVLTKLIGDDLGSIYLKKGDLKEGLRFGLISFGICAGIFAVIAIVQANAPASQGLTASGVSLAVIVSALPWILVWAFANSLMEELWLRGIFLKSSSAPRHTATIVVRHWSLAFRMPIAAGDDYLPIIVFVLGVECAHNVKTDSIVNAVVPCWIRLKSSFPIWFRRSRNECRPERLLNLQKFSRPTMDDKPKSP